MDECSDVTTLFMLRNKFGPDKAILMWAHQKDLLWLEEAQRKANKWPRRFWAWYHCVDNWEKQAVRSKKRLEKGTLEI